jgi:hypothetical protein
MIGKKELLFLVVVFGWVLFWSLIFIPYFNSYLISHPSFPVYATFLVHQIGYWLSFFFMGFILTKKLPHSFRFSLGVICLFISFEIAVPPTCVAPDGNALLTADNLSCKMGNDYFVSWIFNTFFRIPYGYPIMFYLTYIGGTLLFAFLAVLLLKEKELWKALVGGIFG